MIAWTIYLTFAGAVLLCLMPAQVARWLALFTTIAGAAISVHAFFGNEIASAPFMTLTDRPWVPTLGMHYHLAVDGISLVMCLVTGITAVSAVLFSWTQRERA
nr:NADH-quinone oxidoreductase subunit M [Chthoniobacterales bacterium]